MSMRESQIKSEKGESLQIGTLFKFIKSYDGSREKLNSFISNCDNAIDLASDNQKLILFKYILSQLEGKAETACSIKEFDNWEQLSLFLKTQFGEKKHYTHLLTDLQECRQLNTEAVNQFSLRIETCLSKLLTEVTLSNKKKGELSGRTAAMEDLALHTFLLGLKPEISNLVRGKNPSNLNEAINLAVSEEKILMLFNKRNPHSSGFQRPKPQYPSRLPTLNVNTRPQTKQYDRNDNIPFCRYCKIQGHTIDVCRKREYNNNRFKVPQTNQSFTRPNRDFTKPAHIHFVTNNDTHDEPETQEHIEVDETQYNCRDDHLNE